MKITERSLQEALALLDQNMPGKDPDPQQAALYSGMLIMIEKLLQTSVDFDSQEQIHYIIGNIK